MTTAKFSLLSDGILIAPHFIEDIQIARINEELDSVFNKQVFNKNRQGRIDLSKVLSEVSLPSSMLSFNFLELSISIHELIRQKLDREFILTNLEIFSEKNNSRPLFWHTDQRKGMIRAQIYLKGGRNNSGGFMYMRGTQDQDYVTHKLDPNQIVAMKEFIVDCSAAPGSLVIFDSNGFHAKHACLEERRTVMFEFQPKDSKIIKSSILINNRMLTDNVIQNINLFKPGLTETYGGHGLDNESNHYINIKSIVDVNGTYVKMILNRIIGVIKIIKFKALG
jgi:hypothetical protein